MHEPFERGQIQYLSVEFARRVRVIYLIAFQGNVADRSSLSQFYRAATSVGANIREGQYAESPRDFVHKHKIAEKELGEFFYWFGLLSSNKDLFECEAAEDILSRGTAIAKLLASIIKSTRKRHSLT
ncbi:MAG: four helix bundle protein [Ignavibacteria bacterium]|nr:four helix bundle protein [Ignavibacteria bacterium]